MVFKPRQKRQNFELAFSIDGIPLAQAKESVFLGVVIDENLMWKPHILNVSRKISKSLGILYKSSFCLSSASLRHSELQSNLSISNLFTVFLFGDQPIILT